MTETPRRNQGTRARDADGNSSRNVVRRRTPPRKAVQMASMYSLAGGKRNEAEKPMSRQGLNLQRIKGQLFKGGGRQRQIQQGPSRQADAEHQQRPPQGCQWAATTANLTEKNSDGCQGQHQLNAPGRDQQQSNADDPCNQANGTALPFHQGPVGLEAGEGRGGIGQPVAKIRQPVAHRCLGWRRRHGSRHGLPLRCRRCSSTHLTLLPVP